MYLSIILFRVPEEVKQIIKEYSDICANICYENVQRYKVFRKLKDFMK
jgi:hypothetical protein